MNEETKTGRQIALVIDDATADRLLLKHLLIKENFRVLLAEDGEQGVAIFEQSDVDVVFMDVVMPGIGGYEATRRIKALSADQFVPVIFLTALCDQKVPFLCIEAGGDDIICKPFDPYILKAKLQAFRRIRKLNIECDQKRVALQQVHNDLKRDQQIAQRIYHDAITATNVATQSIRTLLRPAAGFSGDHVITAYLPHGDLNALIVDFTGHGLASSIGAIPVAETFRAMTTKGFPMLDILEQINDKVYSLLPTEMFMCGCFISLEREFHSVSIWNGGMPDALIIEGETGSVKHRVSSSNLPLGLKAELMEPGSPEVFEIKKGDRVLAHSDGLNEATNPQGEMFGIQRIERSLAHCTRADEAFTMIQRALDRFCQDSVLRDDITLIDIPCNPSVSALPRTGRAA